LTRRAWLAGGVIVVVLAAIFAGWYFVLSDRDARLDDLNSPSPTPVDALAQIERDYLRHWEVWARANLELKPELLEEVATGAALDALTQQVQAQKEMNQPVRIRVEHNYRIVYPVPAADPDTATVEDSYINHSVRLDPETMEPIEEDPNEQVRVSFTLKKVDGRWKVAEIIEFR
jgi:hypothetical protein